MNVKLPGFAREMARIRVNQEVNKPFIGKPYLKCGQGPGIWRYFFQLGGILGAKHRETLDAFGNAFLGATGEPGAVRTYFTGLVDLVAEAMTMDSTTFGEYVTEKFIRRMKYEGDGALFLLEHGMEKLTPEIVAELAWQYSNDGAALGALDSDAFRTMFEHSNRAVPKEEWDRARAAGLDLPPEQEVMTYQEVEDAENGVFMGYCEECCPELYAVLRTN